MVFTLLIWKKPLKKFQCLDMEHFGNDIEYKRNSAVNQFAGLLAADVDEWPGEGGVGTILWVYFNERKLQLKFSCGAHGQ